jgi:chorismate lyase / 3-hydroxybenzoate synthase
MLRMPGLPLEGQVADQCNIGVFRSRLLLPSMIQASEILQAHIAVPRSPRVTYRTTVPREALSEAGTLAVFGFGAGAPDVDDARWLRVPLESFDAPTPLEVWQVNAEVAFGRDDNVCWSAGGGWLFAAIELDERTVGGIESAAHQAYAALREFMSMRNERYVLRIWNYIADINLGTGDLERYKQFCNGRAAGLGDFFASGYPAATAIGHHRRDPVLQIYLLACVEDGMAVENPRQTSAWHYPRQYGRTSPGFARGMLLPAHDALAISGTASVVGHASAHEGNLEAQLDETLLNLEALLVTSDMPAGFDTHSPLKGYVRHAIDASRVREMLQRRLPGVPVLLMHGDICRRELLVEIDGWRFR